MRSMTGFGMGEAALGDGRVTVELRSLNHRFLELRVRLPPELAEQTFFVEQLCRRALERGRFDVSVRLDGRALPPVEIDVERVRRSYSTLLRLRDELAPGSELPFAVIASQPELIVGPASPDPGPLREALETGLRHALENLDLMRSAEGTALAIELGQRLEAARDLHRSIAERSPSLAQAQAERLKSRVQRLLADMEVDEGRLLTEIALLADRSDITEELVRLGSHFAQFGSLLEAPGPIGRQLDFLLQEIGRETNTIGAKCQDAGLSQLVVLLKAEVERLREQVQNVE
jgi:uncharacterized protein (TIGR00255 family)